MKAAEQGCVDAQFWVECAYNKGIGVKQDKEKALYWYSKSSKQGVSKM
jgi:uncharacterized protein